MNSHKKTIVVVTIFSIAMAALEGAVVVYLRALYYPGEFTVALKMIDERILLTELVREAATILMLLAVGYLAGKNFKERFAYFLLGFAVWDIFYYAWLKVFIDWPSSLFTWDILFLIPVTWLGPVLAPIICSLTMIALALVLLYIHEDRKISTQAWSLLAAGSLLILFTFMKDYGNILISHGLLSDYAHIMQNKTFLDIASNYIPQAYSWNIFWIGELFLALGILKIYSSTFWQAGIRTGKPVNI
jgi:hypothetical protein